MAESKKTIVSNVYTKLLEARVQFLENGVEKSGKNMHMKFRYFELEDIVPTATRIFKNVGIVPIVNFTNEFATLTMVNVEDPADQCVFSSPFRELTGNAAVNPLQAIGAAHTYLRRYLYMIALDIC